MKGERPSTRGFGKVVELKEEHREEPTAGLKASLLLEMLPDQVQVAVAQRLTSMKVDYDTLKAQIKLMASAHTGFLTPPARGHWNDGIPGRQRVRRGGGDAEGRRGRSVERNKLDVRPEPLCEVMSEGQQRSVRILLDLWREPTTFRGNARREMTAQA